MQKTKPFIHILPQKRTVKSNTGERLLETLIRHNIFLRIDCGGKGKCHKCRVDKSMENSGLESIDSCQYKVESDISILIPESSMATSYSMGKARLIFPQTFKERCKTKTLSEEYGVAVDLGTTTIALYLCNMAKGEVTASIAVKNSQAVFGDDVISRITAVGENFGKLHDFVIKNIAWGVETLFSGLGKDKNLLSRMVVVGNPTMIHIFSKTDPSSIGVSPFLPVFYNSKHFSSGSLGFNFSDIPVKTLPNVSGFIGGDILAAGVASEIETQPDGTLLIDLGTNGELMFKIGEHLYATSCATGPAFEGATLSCGMPGIPGAIDSIEIGTDQYLSSFSVINSSEQPDLKPSGICGTGIINAVAQLYQKGVIRPDGAFSDGSDKFMLIAQDYGTGQLPIYISQKDIRSVQLGKSALMSGIEFLLGKAGLDQPEKIIVAGAMGFHIKTLDLIRLGMIPKIDPDKIETAGNLAGSGAVMALCDDHYVANAAYLANKIEIIELATNMEFQNTFIKNLKFPTL